MELWIRSQDKQILKQAYELDIYDIFEEGLGYFYFIEESGTTLGQYKTKERALEVLDEIQKLIKPTFKINYEYDDSQPIITGEWLKSLKAESKIEELSCYVYEMPKE